MGISLMRVPYCQNCYDHFLCELCDMYLFGVVSLLFRDISLRQVCMVTLICLVKEQARSFLLLSHALLGRVLPNLDCCINRFKGKSLSSRLSLDLTLVPVVMRLEE